MDIVCKRVYEPAAAADGARILVDRVWPRGLRKAELPLDAWAREIAPSTELRRWFGHAVARWPEFQRRYRSELSHQKEQCRELLQVHGKRRITLLYGARDTEHNQAVVLRDFLVEHTGELLGHTGE